MSKRMDEDVTPVSGTAFGTRRARLKAGELGLDIYGRRDVLAERGGEWRD